MHPLLEPWQHLESATPQWACVRNVLAKLVSVELDGSIHAIIFVRPERIYCAVDDMFYPKLEGMSEGDDPPFASEGQPESGIHQQLLGWVILTEGSESYVLRSYRQRVTLDSLQCVIAKSADPTKGDYADCDIDLGGARTDVVGFVRHMDELVVGGLTDHVALREGLLRDAVIGPILKGLDDAA